MKIATHRLQINKHWNADEIKNCEFCEAPKRAQSARGVRNTLADFSIQIALCPE